MDEKLLRFFKKIGFQDLESFDEASLDKCIVSKKNNSWKIVIKSDNVINIDSILKLKTLAKDGIDSVEKIDIIMKYNNITDNDILDYFIYLLNNEIENNNSLQNINTDLITVTNKTVNIVVNSTIEEKNIINISKKIINILTNLGIENVKIQTEVNLEVSKKIKEQIEKEKEDLLKNAPIYRPVNEASERKWVPKKKINFTRDGLVPIKSIIKEERDCNIDAYIFGSEFNTITKKDGTPLYLATIKVSDNTSSILMKKFAKDAEDFSNLAKELKNGSWYHFVGDVRYDTFAKDLVFNLKTFEPIDSPIIKRKDSAPVKRVELHAHTMMSQMDGVIDENKLVKQAISWGMPGIGITDHDGCQAFPVVFETVTKYNSGKLKEFDSKIKENEAALEEIKKTNNQEGINKLEEMIDELKDEKAHYKPFKIAYGAELDMCESYLNVCFNPRKEEIKNNTFVVFDTETTGFNPGLSDQMIEIGAVKIKNGSVIDRFDELINPGHHIDEAITKVTNISDDDVKDSDSEENVTKRFKEWIKDYPLVAHNAKFDKNMLDMAYYKYNLGKLTNPIIDTLMLSRVINRDLKKHSLAALGKFYGVDTGEESDESDNSTNNDIKLDDEDAKVFDDILIDGESIIRLEDEEYNDTEITTEEVIKKKHTIKYLKTTYKSSKTDKVHIDVKTSEGTELINFNNEYKLHPAENDIEISYVTPFGPKSITVIVYVGSHHGADVDAENTGYIFNKMLKQIEGINTLDELNDTGKVMFQAYRNDPKMLKNIGDNISFKNYIRPITDDDDETVINKFGYPFKEFDNLNYIWKYEWCHDDYLQMYENIPGKTYAEDLANIYDSTKHVTFICKNHDGLKNLFKLISYANTGYEQRNARIPRKFINELRDGLLIGSACLNSEIFYIAETRSDEELCKAMEFYDYIEVQPLENYEHLLRNHDVDSMSDLKKLVKKIIRCAKKMNKIIIATGDVHVMDPDDNIYREIIVNQNVPGKGRHELARYLNSYPVVNPNKENIKNAIKKAENNGVKLNNIDIKVLKYIYALEMTPEMPITSSNLSELYDVSKKSEDEAQLINEDAKKNAIDSSLRNLQISGIISFNYDEGTYTLNSKYDKVTSYKEGHIPNQYFRTTNEMLDAFKWLNDPELVNDIVIDNTNKILDMLDSIEVVVYPLKPFSPIIPHSQETCRDLVFDKAHSMYGDPLPRNIEERIAEEFYGGKIFMLVHEKMDREYPNMSDEEKDSIFSSELHKVIMSGYDGVVDLMKKHVLSETPDLNDEDALQKAKDSLNGIIGGGFDVIYLIAQKLVKHSNDRGYLVGSRGSVGSSFVASMMGITECNSLPPHYYCPECHYSMFHEEDGSDFKHEDPQTHEIVPYLSGFDLPERKCPKCGAKMIHQGNDMPFATFLGFEGEKVPDIDLNFSGDDQPYAHEYTKVLFGTDNVYRAGTIATVADKTAYGYVQGYFEESEYRKLKTSASSLGLKIPTKDDLKKKKIITCTTRSAEVERLSIGCTGVKRTTGQHPGGIVVVPGYKDVFDFTPFQYPADDPTAAWRTTHFDYHKIEADLLKLDILGHDDPTVLRMLQELSGMDVTKIDLGDIDTMKIFTGPEILGKYNAYGKDPIEIHPDDLRGLTKDGRKYCPTGTLGIPEFGTSFLLGMLEETKPTTFAELIKISGLSHGTDVWLGNAQELIHNHIVPFSKVIGCRDDIMVNLIAWGIPAGKAFKIMEFVRKGRPTKAKKPDDPQTWEEYKKYMRDNGIPEYYIDSCQKIKYMFPKAHATAYVTSAFRIAYFKVHYPIWYYCAYLSIRRDQFDIASMIHGSDAIRNKIDEIDAEINPSNKDIDTRETLLLCLEMTVRGFYFKNIDIMKSDAKNFIITDDNKGLIIPFRALDGLGENVALNIVKAREDSPFISIEDLKVRGKCPSSAIDKLKELGCLDNLPESNQLSLF